MPRNRNKRNHRGRDGYARDPATTDRVVEGVEPLEPRSVRTSPARQRIRRRAGSGDPYIDRKIRELLDDPKIQVGNEDRLEDILQSAFRMARTANRGEMKLASRAFREMGRAFRVFAPYRGIRKVSIFGSARTAAHDPEYRIAHDFAAAIAARGWMVITGAGPGIMAAGHEGAGKDMSFGVGIKLPAEQSANTFISGDPKLIDFKYFFTRKVTFMKESDAFVLLPGGYGTLDEAFELLTLMQTGKTAIRPVVLLEADDSGYWSQWAAFVRTLVDRALVSPEDLSLFARAATPADCVREIERFYANYDSARFVGERLVLRMRRAPGAAELDRLRRDFADIVASGTVDVIHPTAAERKDEDALNMQRIAFVPVHNFGRIRQLIDALNALPAHAPPAPPEPAEAPPPP
ncbi:MAG TPA: TIGR00730 family Rossman fold protein [Dehalococcoidia bacterium]|nr:TIGR00730 family Rossman fold protein [Dehalococcoidia bacterium]